MKRVNLLDYVELAEALANAKRVLSANKAKAGPLYFALLNLPAKLRAFAADDNGFSACKYVATELATSIGKWNKTHMDKEDGTLVIENYDVELSSWDYAEVATKVDTFRTVFEAESRDVDVYSVGQVSIYRTSALVSAGALMLDEDTRSAMSNDAISEFNNAGRCLAFDLPTACGFHALRALELVMDDYLTAFNVKTDKFKSWMDYINAAEVLIADDKAVMKPSKKVAAMLDRMRVLDRNPLMHPRDTLDVVGADQLLKLASVTVVEMVKDKKANEAKADEKTFLDVISGGVA